MSDFPEFLYRVTSNRYETDQYGFLKPHNDTGQYRFGPQGVPLVSLDEWEFIARIFAFPYEYGGPRFTFYNHGFSLLTIETRNIELICRESYYLTDGEFFGLIHEENIVSSTIYDWVRTRKPVDLPKIQRNRSDVIKTKGWRSHPIDGINENLPLIDRILGIPED